MNDLSNIMTLLLGATPGVGQDALSGLQGADAAGFLNFLLQPEGDAAELPADIAALADALPVDMLRAKLADLLKQEAPVQQTVVTDADLGIQPSLTQDLMAKFVEYLQPRTVMPGTPLAQEMAATLDPNTHKNIETTETPLAVAANTAAPTSGVEDAAAVAEATPKTEIKPADAAAAPVVDDGIMSLLKDKVASLQATGADTRKLEETKQDMIRLMEDQGLDSTEINVYLGALAHFLRQEAPVAQTQAMAPALKIAPDAAKAPVADTDGTELPTIADLYADAEETRNDTSDTQAQKAPAQDMRAKISGLHISAETMRALADGNTAPVVANDMGASQASQIADAADTANFGKGFTLDSAAQPQHTANHMVAARGVSGEAVTQMVSLQLQHNAQNKTSQMTLQLNPAELGHLDIKMTFEKDGQMRARLSVEKPETLALLQRDAAQLERTLQQAGLKLDEQSISFDLRQQHQETFGSEHREHFARAQRHPEQNDTTTLQAAIAVETHGYVSSGRVNIII